MASKKEFSLTFRIKKNLALFPSPTSWSNSKISLRNSKYALFILMANSIRPLWRIYSEKTKIQKIPILHHTVNKICCVRTYQSYLKQYNRQVFYFFLIIKNTYFLFIVIKSFIFNIKFRIDCKNFFLKLRNLVKKVQSAEKIRYSSGHNLET